MSFSRQHSQLAPLGISPWRSKSYSQKPKSSSPPPPRALSLARRYPVHPAASSPRSLNSPAPTVTSAAHSDHRTIAPARPGRMEAVTQHQKPTIDPVPPLSMPIATSDHAHAHSLLIIHVLSHCLRSRNRQAIYNAQCRLPCPRCRSHFAMMIHVIQAYSDRMSSRICVLPVLDDIAEWNLNDHLRI